MSCFTDASEMKNFYSFRVRDPSRFLKDRLWVGEDEKKYAGYIKKGAYVVVGIMKGGKKAVQSIKIPKEGLTQREARKLASRISDLLHACPKPVGK